MTRTTERTPAPDAPQPGAAADPAAWLTAREAALAAGVNERTIRRAIARGDLLATRRHGRFHIAPAALAAYQTRRPAPEPRASSPRVRRPAAAATLPALPTAIIGRDRDVRAGLALLAGQDGRLLTLTGPGGVGKTRLALEIAHAYAPTLPDGAVFVPLEAVQDPGQLISALAQRLGAAPADGRPPRAALLEAVQHRRQLVVLDNFEHLLEEAVLVADLLAASPGLQVLATSREALRLRGETELVVSPLALPDLEAPATAEIIGRSAAVELFVRRAQAAHTAFLLTDANANAVRGICHGLDGLPLAIELAAAQTRHASPEMQLARLAQRLDLLIDGARDLPDRQSTMRTAIGWSYDLLNPREQAVFRHLSVFAGGFTADAATTLLANAARDDLGPAGPEESPLAEHEIQRGLVSLVNKSLLQSQATGDAQRFTMLETIREFSVEQAARHEDLPALRTRHAATFLALVESAAPVFHGPDEAAALSRLEMDLANLRAALAWAGARPDCIEQALRLANGLFWLWYVRGYHLEGLEWFTALLTRPEAASAAGELATGMIHAGWLALRMGKTEMALTFLTDALARCQRLGLARGTAFARGSCGFVRLVGLGDPAGALPFLQEGQAEAHAAGDAWVEAMHTYGQSVAALMLGNLAEAQTLAMHSLAISLRSGDAQGMAANQAFLGQIAREHGDDDAAMRHFTDALANYQRVGDRGNIGTCVESLAGLLVSTGQAEQGARLMGAAAAFRQRIGTPVSGHEQARHMADLTAAQAALSDSAFRAAWQAGAMAPLGDMLASLRPAARLRPGATVVLANRDDAGGAAALTRRERQILDLVSAGHTDRQIAHILSISPETVTKHIGNVLGKLGVRSRTAAAVHYLTSQNG